MRKTKFLTLIAFFATLFMNFGTLFAQNIKNFKFLNILPTYTNCVRSVCWSPDGKYLAGDGGDNTVMIWDANSVDEIKSLKGHSDNVQSVSWSPDGRYLASGSWDETIIIWDANSGQRLKTLQGNS